MLPNYNQTKPILPQIQKQFHELILRLIHLNMASRAENSKFHNYLGLVGYLQEFGTVTVDIGRQTGKTSFILDHASGNDLVIGRNMHTIKDMDRSNSKPYYTTYDTYKDNLALLGHPPVNPFNIIYLNDYLFSPFADKNVNHRFLCFLMEHGLATKNTTIVRLG